MKEVKVIEANSERVIRNNSIKFNKLRVAPYCRVSTGSEEQKNSYDSQRKYYRDLIEKKDEWELVDIYSDEAISGTQVFKRTDFQRMINDAIEGKIDLIITKSISRFARNTLDTLKYVRLLKEKNIGIMFEKENINTLTMNGELLLVILSSMAQQESESISGNVKIGLKMKMSRGEMVGFSKCLGYDYDKETKTISLNEKEAEIIKYIFDRYINGAGTYVIAKELTNLGYKTVTGKSKWGESVIRGMLKNEKYKGDLLLGKTFTVDPISHKRLSNMGETEKYYVENHHEPIISKEIWDKSQEIRKKRYNKDNNHIYNKTCFNRKHNFSSYIKCGHCGSSYVRRTWHAGGKHEKHTWSCIGKIKQGRNFCKESETIDEKTLEKIFLQAYSLILKNNEKIIENLLIAMEDVLKDENGTKLINEKAKEKEKIKKKYDKLLDMKLEGNINEEVYNKKKFDIGIELSRVDQDLQELKDKYSDEEGYKSRIKKIREKLSGLKKIDQFDREVFECIIEKIDMGCYNSNGEYKPDRIIFKLKSGEQIKGFAKTTKTNNIANKFKENEVCSNNEFTDNNVYPKTGDYSCRDSSCFKTTVNAYSRSIFTR